MPRESVLDVIYLKTIVYCSINKNKLNSQFMTHATKAQIKKTFAIRFPYRGFSQIQSHII